jgi:hypothetical protein
MWSETGCRLSVAGPKEKDSEMSLVMVSRLDAAVAMGPAFRADSQAERKLEPAESHSELPT